MTEYTLTETQRDDLIEALHVGADHIEAWAGEYLSASKRGLVAETCRNFDLMRRLIEELGGTPDPTVFDDPDSFLEYLRKKAA